MADLAAYEVCHAHERGQKHRYPWMRLLNKYQRVSLDYASELFPLLGLSRNDFPHEDHAGGKH
jgi:hypothetical protein